MNQIDKYNKQIKNNRDRIIAEYARAFAEYNSLMNTDIRPPEKVYERCGLLVFGYDSLQKERIQKLLIKNASLEEHKFKPIGDPKNIIIKDLFKTLT